MKLPRVRALLPSWGSLLRGWAHGTGASGLPGRAAEDTPSRHVPGRTGIQFPLVLLLLGTGVVTLRACSSCATGHFWGLEPWAGIYWLSLWPVGEVRRGWQVTGSGPAVPVALPSCPLHSLASCFQAASGTGPGLACPEPGACVQGHLNCCWGEQLEWVGRSGGRCWEGHWASRRPG